MKDLKKNLNDTAYQCLGPLNTVEYLHVIQGNEPNLHQFIVDHYYLQSRKTLFVGNFLELDGSHVLIFIHAIGKEFQEKPLEFPHPLTPHYHTNLPIFE